MKYGNQETEQNIDLLRNMDFKRSMKYHKG